MFDVIKKPLTQMNLCCIKYLMFTKNNNIKVKCKMDGKINLYSTCIDCDFKNLTVIKKNLVIH